ncbi:MAG: hypothetical protein M3017_01715 [Actinomycetota bacterium]|nr:hypothetical protein [Actinomycetota bacterium]
MSPTRKYSLPDGSPLYGVRSATPAPVQTVMVPADPAQIPRTAVRLGSRELAVAIDYRLHQPWSDAPDPGVASLRAAHPKELALAEALVRTELGDPKTWRNKAGEVFDRHREAVKSRRKKALLTGKLTVLRGLLILALAIVPIGLVAVGAPLLALIAAGLAAVALAVGCGQLITTHERIPEYPKIRLRWLADLRHDVVDATFVAVLISAGVAVESQVAAAASRGWDSLRFVAAKMDEISRGHHI